MPQSHRLPVLTLALIAVNLLAATFVVFDPELVFRFGFRADMPSLLTAFAAVLLHANVLHLLANMLFLAAVGPFVEEAAGPWRFLTVYVVGGLAGVGAHWALMAGSPSPQPLVGASAAIAACVGYASVRFVNARVPLAPKIQVPVWLVAVVWVAIQALAAMVRIGDAEGGTAYWAHLGGFLAGVVLSVVFRAPAQASLSQGRRTLDEMSERGPAALLAAAEAHLARHPGDLHALRQKAEAHLAMHDQPHAAEAYRRLADATTGPDQASALRALAGIPGGLREVPSVRRARWALAWESAEPEIARTLLESIVTGAADDPQRPEAMVALAGLLRDTDNARSRGLVEELAAQYSLHPATQIARQRGLLP